MFRTLWLGGDGTPTCQREGGRHIRGPRRLTRPIRRRGASAVGRALSNPPCSVQYSVTLTKPDPSLDQKPETEIVERTDINPEIATDKF